MRAEKAFLDILRSNSDEGSPRELPDPDEMLEGKAGEAQLELLHTETEIARRTAALSLARKLLARRVIRAPMDGIVLERNIEPGESIPASPPGPPLFVIGADPATLRLEVEIDERYVGGVLPGSGDVHRACPRRVRVLGHDPRGDPGADRRAEPGAVSGRDRRRQPGRRAAARHVRRSVDLPVVTGRDALAVPNAALSSRRVTTRSSLSWSDDHGRAEAVAVGVGVANADLTEVMGPGVAAGRVVVTDASPSTCRVTPLVPADCAPTEGKCCGPLLAPRNCCATATMGAKRFAAARPLLCPAA